MEQAGSHPPGARDRILATAHDLFYAEGIRATGVDRIIAASGVAKLTFYRHFPAKDDLVRAFLALRHERWMAWFVDALARHGAREGGGLAPVVPALAEWFAAPQFRGCAFINAAAELGATDGAVLAAARAHKEEVAQLLAGLLPARRRTPARADALLAAVDGAIVLAQLGAPTRALEALRCALRAQARPPRA